MNPLYTQLRDQLELYITRVLPQRSRPANPLPRTYFWHLKVPWDPLLTQDPLLAYLDSEITLLLLWATATPTLASAWYRPLIHHIRILRERGKKWSSSVDYGLQIVEQNYIAQVAHESLVRARFDEDCQRGREPADEDPQRPYFQFSHWAPAANTPRELGEVLGYARFNHLCATKATWGLEETQRWIAADQRVQDAGFPVCSCADEMCAAFAVVRCRDALIPLFLEAAARSDESPDFAEADDMYRRMRDLMKDWLAWSPDSSKTGLSNEESGEVDIK